MTPLLFVDRDGTLIEEPDDFQIDRFDKLRFVDGVIAALLRLRDAGYQFVMVSNQDGLGGAHYPRASFDGPHDLMMQVFRSQGIAFREVLIDTSLPADNAPTRKPRLGLVMHYLRERDIDWGRSAMVGDRETDNEFARNLGVRAFQLRTDQFGGQWDWAGVAHALVDAPRTAQVCRNTRETRVLVELDLDRAAPPRVSTGLGFFDHMLEQIGQHGGFALSVRCEGDLQIDEHHTIEDCALALGQALREALGDKRGIGRYGFAGQTLPAGNPEPLAPLHTAVPAASFELPMDDALARVALDFSGRAYCVFEGDFTRSQVGDMPTELVAHFFRSLCDGAGLNLNLRVSGDNDHHKIEACFKVVARALRQALRREGHGMPSTKGVL